MDDHARSGPAWAVMGAVSAVGASALVLSGLTIGWLVFAPASPLVRDRGSGAEVAAPIQAASEPTVLSGASVRATTTVAASAPTTFVEPRGSDSTSIDGLHINVPLAPDARIVIDGIGGVRVGMTVAEGEASTRTTWTLEDATYVSPGCSYAHIPGVDGLAFMLAGDDNVPGPSHRVVRLDVDGPQWETPRGIKVGDPAALVRATYPTELRQTPHHYVEGGWYLDYEPTEAKDAELMLRFQVVDDVVVSIISGFGDYVGLIEGCA